MAFDKIAIDSAAKSYWQKLFGEYGETMTREIPRKIKASIDSVSKTASAEIGRVIPIGYSKNGNTTILEGHYRQADKNYLFVAKIVGNNIDSVQATEVK